MPLCLSYLVGDPSFNVKRLLSKKQSESNIPLGQLSGEPHEVCLALKSPNINFGSGIEFKILVMMS